MEMEATLTAECKRRRQARMEERVGPENES